MNSMSKVSIQLIKYAFVTKNLVKTYMYVN